MDGSGDYLRYVFGSTQTDPEFCVIMALRRRGAGGDDRFFSITRVDVSNDYDGTDRCTMLVFGSGNEVRFYRNSLNSPMPVGYFYSPCVVEGMSDGVNYRWGLHGITTGNAVSDTSPGTALAATDLFFCAGWVGSNVAEMMNCDLYEAVAYFGANMPTPSEIEETKRYLAAKYAIGCAFGG